MYYKIQDNLKLYLLLFYFITYHILNYYDKTLQTSSCYRKRKASYVSIEHNIEITCKTLCIMHIYYSLERRYKSFSITLVRDIKNQ